MRDALQDGPDATYLSVLLQSNSRPVAVHHSVTTVLVHVHAQSCIKTRLVGT